MSCGERNRIHGQRASTTIQVKEGTENSDWLTFNRLSQKAVNAGLGTEARGDH